MGDSDRYNRSDEAAYDYIRRTGRWPSREAEFQSELPVREKPVQHSKPMTNARPENAPNYATVDERGVETPIEQGRSAPPPAD
ncbi:MAG TPA: hypothetical protein V6D05_05090 [Stenomitos sp.]